MEPSALADLDSVLLLLMVVSAVGLLVSLTSAPARKDRASGEVEQVSRWRVFRILPDVLHEDASEKTAVVAEEVGGVRLLARPFRGKGWEIATSGRERRAAQRSEWPTDKLKVEISRRGVLTARFDARLDGRPWVSVRKLAGGWRSRPEIRLHRAGLPLKVAGAPLERDYEVRQGGKLVAMVSEPSPGTEGAKGKYTLEVLRSVDPEPLLALVLCLEAALPPMR